MRECGSYFSLMISIWSNVYHRLNYTLQHTQHAFIQSVTELLMYTIIICGWFSRKSLYILNYALLLILITQLFVYREIFNFICVKTLIFTVFIWFHSSYLMFKNLVLIPTFFLSSLPSLNVNVKVHKKKEHRRWPACVTRNKRSLIIL